MKPSFAWAGFITIFLSVLLLSVSSGCQQAQPGTPVQADQASAAQQEQGGDAVSVLTDSDTERAEGAIARDRQERAAQRRPHDPDRRRVVDQPSTQR